MWILYSDVVLFFEDLSYAKNFIFRVRVQTNKSP
jgi:hypothetical protein